MARYIDGLAEVPTTVDEALYRTVSDMRDGVKVETVKNGQAEGSFEVLHYRTGMTDARARICVKKPLNLVGAVARLVWMVAGSNRLADIAFYEPKVANYTDDRISVPGSSYGKRLFDAAPGLDQIQGVIRRLSKNQDTRQAAAVVWVPEDAVRESSDIPCTFGMFFHVRQGQLIMRTVMRSNNAFRLMPYNFFEFSMLGEIIAATLGVEMGPYLHDAASMHVYTHVEWASTLAVVDGPAGESVTMPPMGHAEGGRTAIKQASALARLEAELRHAYTREAFAKARSDAGDELDPYWLALFNVLAGWGAAARGWSEIVEDVLAQLPDYFDSAREKVTALLSKVTSGTEATATETVDDGMLPLDWEVPMLTSVSAAAAVDAAREGENRDAAIIAAMEFQFENNQRFTHEEVAQLAAIMTAEGSLTSARSDDPNAPLEFTADDVRAAIEKLGNA